MRPPRKSPTRRTRAPPRSNVPFTMRTRSMAARNAAAQRDIYSVTRYEGTATQTLLATNMESLADVCSRPNGGVSDKYIEETLRGMAASNFAVTVTHLSTGRIVAFALCTLVVPWRRGVRCVEVNILCASPLHKGLGSLVFREVEAFTQEVGARRIVLSALALPGTIAFYKRHKLLRGMGNRSPPTLTQAQRAFIDLLAANPPRNRNYLAAMNREYYAENTPDQTVVFYKDVPAPRGTALVEWGMEHGRFRQSRTVPLGMHIRMANSLKKLTLTSVR